MRKPAAPLLIDRRQRGLAQAVSRARVDDQPVAQGDGAYIFDVDGNRYIDLIGSWGPLILGHSHAGILDAIAEAADVAARQDARNLDRYRLEITNRATARVIWDAKNVQPRDDEGEKSFVLVVPRRFFRPGEYDIVVYGGTSAGVIAAVQARKMGKSVVIVGPDRHLGGLSSGGLGFTDTGNKAVIGGLSREFYHRIWRRYQDQAAWRWQRREEYGNKGQGTPAIDGEQRTMWIFEPHVAERVFEELVKETLKLRDRRENERQA